MSKFVLSERNLVKSIVAVLSLKRIPDKEIIKEIERQTNKTITSRYLTEIRQQIKKESYEWYTSLREGQYVAINTKNDSNSINRNVNYDTIKLDPRTLAKLRNCYFIDQANRPDTITYDELLNRLMDKVEEKERWMNETNCIRKKEGINLCRYLHSHIIHSNYL